MTQDEIIALAEQAGMVPFKLFGGIRFIEVWLPEIEAFAKLVGAHTLMNIDPSKFMSHQEGIEAGRLAERQWLIDSGLIGVLKHCEDLLREDGHEDAVDDVQNMIAKIRARGQA
jgi:hypothetical protein